MTAAAPALAQQGHDDIAPSALGREQITQLQRKLSDEGFAVGRVDGRWGRNTATAVRGFQEKKGLRPTGQLDQPTLQALGLADAAAPVTRTQETIPPVFSSTPPVPPASVRDAAPPDAAGSATAGRSDAHPIPPTANPPPAVPDAAATAANPAPGTNPTGASAGSQGDQKAASGDSNQAIATVAANALQPAHGANSFSRGQAQARIARRGFQDVSSLRKDADGVWRGTATKDGQQIRVWLDYKGNVGQQ